MSDYKSTKEAFVSGTEGSTVTHVNAVSAAALCSLILYNVVKNRLLRDVPTNLALEWILLVLPLLLSMTLFAEMPMVLCSLLLAPALGIYLSRGSKDEEEPPLSPVRIRSRTPSFSPEHDESSRKTSSTLEERTRLQLPIANLPSLTIFRAHMLLMTILAILAVDFDVFPRSLAKCETFGVSLMDLGVGSFVFSQGVVSAIPLLKEPKYLLSPLTEKTVPVLKKVSPVIALGFIRLLSVKGTDYPEHVSEYGVHWNFFFTLALVPVMQVLLHPIILHVPISLVAFSVATVHQLLLSLTTLQDFTLNAPRSNLLAANKEGIVSLTGYLAIQLFGLSVGTMILPSSPSEFRKLQRQLVQYRSTGTFTSPKAARSGDNPGEKPRESKGRDKTTVKRQNGKTSIELLSYAVLWWTCLGLCYLTGVGGWVSRRLANFPYILWIVAYNTSFVLLNFLLDNFFSTRPHVSPHHQQNSNSLYPPPPSSAHHQDGTSTETDIGAAPPLLEATNRNGLVLFLIANVATGIVNLSIQTMYATDTVAYAVLSMYSFCVCAIAWSMRKRRIIKL